MYASAQSLSRSVYRYHLAPSGPDGDNERDKAARDQQATGGEDLPYKVEVWDLEKKAVEQILAVTANASIGYAAYYEATREFPDRFVTLRHKNRTMARWNPPGH